MLTQQLLSHIQQGYNFTPANQLLSKPALKNYWKHWFCCELVPLLANNAEQQVELEKYYPAQPNEHKDKAFLSIKTGQKQAQASEKRGASKCDFYLPNQELYVELRCGHASSLLKGKELDKFKQDQLRVNALKQANATLNIATLFIFYGSFDNAQCEQLAQLDDNQTPSYVLDTGLTGSSSIARLSHMQRHGDPRVLLAACVI